MEAMPKMPDARVILLGASNLTAGFPQVIETAKLLFGDPLEILATLGVGRSYGKPSSVLTRKLPDTFTSGLWEAVQGKTGVPTYGLITDIGNDIAYDVPVERILLWIDRTVDLMVKAEARTVITLLPLRSMKNLKPLRFTIARSILFPRCRLSLAETLERARELNDGLRNLGERRGISIVEPDPAWYGIDAIHIRRRCAVEAWFQILLPWRPEAHSVIPERATWRRWLSLRFLRPERWSIFGIERSRLQPCKVLMDGSTISLF